MERPAPMSRKASPAGHWPPAGSRGAVCTEAPPSFVLPWDKVHGPSQGQAAGFFTSGTLIYMSILCPGAFSTRFQVCAITTWATDVSLPYLKAKGYEG